MFFLDLSRFYVFHIDIHHDNNVDMFVDVIPNRKSPPAILIRQSYREGGKVKKRTLANISKLPPNTVEKIRGILRGAVLADAPAKLEGAFAISRSLQHGNAAAVLAALRGCGVDRVIASRRSRSRDLAVALVAQRILEPGSKLAAARLFRPETAVSTLASQLGLPENVSEDRLYETMDWLLERQPRIEKALAEKHSGEGSPVLYDLTSVWSYSRTCSLVKNGYSRDGKTGLPQIEFGLLCDADGRPVAVEAFPGNASDPSAVAAQVGKLRDRFGLKRAVFVGDRGMAAQARVREDLEPNGYDWIFALRASGVGALAENGALQPTLFDERDMAEIKCRELFPGERLVVCRNPLLAEERTRKRKDLIAAAAQDLIEIRRAVRRDKRPLRNTDAIRRRAERALDKRKMRKHFDLKIGTGSFSWKRKKQNIADEAALDGFYVVRTNVKEERMSAAAVVETYKRLGRVERAFRMMKASDLQVRPIRHRLEPRVRAHLLICMLACYVEKHMREALAPMLFDDEHGPVRDSPVAKAERSPQARRKAASKRTSSGEDVHDFRGLLEQLGTLTMNRIEPSGPGKPGFDVPASPTPIQDRALRLLNAKIPMR